MPRRREGWRESLERRRRGHPGGRLGNDSIVKTLPITPMPLSPYCGAPEPKEKDVLDLCPRYFDEILQVL